jgi:hypothetical protein
VKLYRVGSEWTGSRYKRESTPFSDAWQNDFLNDLYATSIDGQNVRGSFYPEAGWSGSWQGKIEDLPVGKDAKEGIGSATRETTTTTTTERVQLVEEGQVPQELIGKTIGKHNAIKGTVEVFEDGVWKKLTWDRNIRFGDRIRTGSGSRLQVTLEDDTLFTVGPDAEWSIDTSVYDPSRPVSVTLSLSEGLFRWVTSEVAKKAPGRNTTIRTSVMGMSIRGTDVIVGHDVVSGESTVRVNEGLVAVMPVNGTRETEVAARKAAVVKGDVVDVSELDSEEWDSLVDDLSFIPDDQRLALTILGGVGLVILVGLVIVILVVVLVWKGLKKGKGKK